MSQPPLEIRRRGVVAVIVRDQRLLVIRRASGVAAPGMYCFPGGGIEPGEIEEEAYGASCKRSWPPASAPCTAYGKA